MLKALTAVAIAFVFAAALILDRHDPVPARQPETDRAPHSFRLPLPPLLVQRATEGPTDAGSIRAEPVPKRQEGETCDEGAESPCAPGLICAFPGMCGRPCELDSPTSCPRRFQCWTNPHGPSTCHPVACDGDSDCPAGATCVRWQGGSVGCFQLRTTINCVQHGCPADERCMMYFAADERSLEMRCERPCGRTWKELYPTLATTCPDGMSCGTDSFCHPRCTADRDCPAGELCLLVDSGMGSCGTLLTKSMIPVPDPRKE